MSRPGSAAPRLLPAVLAVSALAAAPAQAAAPASAGAGPQAPVVVYSPELALTLDCSGPLAPRKLALEQLLRLHGFRVFDRPQLDALLSEHVFGTESLSIDAGNRIVQFLRLDPTTNDYGLIFSSPPGSRADRRLDAQLSMLVEGHFGCSVRSLRHGGGNGAGTQRFYDNLLHKIRLALRSAP